jgi:heptosyltransferase-2
MPEINGEEVHIDCLHFRGDIPCRPNKEQGYHCNGCPVHTPVEKRILIIKLGAIGDVIRTTSSLSRSST